MVDGFIGRVKNIATNLVNAGSSTRTIGNQKTRFACREEFHDKLLRHSDFLILFGDYRLQGRFMKDFLSNEAWRERYELSDFLHIEVRNGAQVGEFQTAAFEPVRIEQLRRALPPVVVRLGSNDAVRKITAKTINAVDVQCVEYQTSGANHQEENELCINRVDGIRIE